MNIALIHYRLVYRGGLETRFLNYIEYFTRAGHEVTVIYSKKSGQIKLPGSVKEIQIHLGMVPKILRKWYFNRKLKAAMGAHRFDFSLSLERTSHQDAVLAPNTHLGYLRALGKTFLTPADYIQIHLDKECFMKCRIIYACSAMVKDELVTLYKVPAEKITVLYPPLNTKDYYPPAAGQRSFFKKKCGMDENKTTFLFASTSHRRKGLPLLLKIFEALQNEPFELCIVGKPKVKTGLKNVKYLGYFTNLREFYSGSDFTIHPAVYEPFGQIISESLQCGTPVLVSSKVGAKEIIDKKSGVVAYSPDPRVWIKIIRDSPSLGLNAEMHNLREKNIYLEAHVKKILETAFLSPR